MTEVPHTPERSGDRLTRDLEPAWKGDPVGIINEIVLTGAAVHLERLSRKTWMLIIENGDAHFHLTVRKLREYEMTINGRPLGDTESWQQP